jgi:hypothetical protein
MTDPLMTLSAADPARDRVPTAAEAARMDEELARLLTMEARPKTRAPRRPGRRWALVPIAAAAVFAALALAVPDRGPQPLQPAAASAATVLADLGEKVAASPAQTGRYAYERRLSYVSHMRPRPSGKGSFVVVLPHEDEQWVEDDGSAIVRSVIHDDQPTFPTPEDKADYDAAGTNRPALDSRPYTVDAITVAGLSAAEVRALPTDPVALRARIEGGEITLTAMVGQLLATPLTPPAVKVALFEVLKGLPGATLLPLVTDPKGRTGVGVQFDTPAWKTLFLFDRETGALLGTRSIGHKELPGREIDDWSLVLQSSRRDDAPTTVR